MGAKLFSRKGPQFPSSFKVSFSCLVQNFKRKHEKTKQANKNAIWYRNIIYILYTCIYYLPRCRVIFQSLQWATLKLKHTGVTDPSIYLMLRPSAILRSRWRPQVYLGCKRQKNRLLIYLELLPPCRWSIYSTMLRTNWAGYLQY